MTAENAADRLRVSLLQFGHVHAEGEAGSAPWHPRHPVAEALPRQRLTISRSREGDARVGMEVVDVRGINERVHGGVN
ncbi:unannotated protein [freshwater metagenome]|uniref:Unannotated protein n=1 Tax=freshwater metagenome TaxID=449393 RepID=A0A6J6TVI4_9ZZZZ